jgi:hypothetical protein
VGGTHLSGFKIYIQSNRHRYSKPGEDFHYYLLSELADFMFGIVSIANQTGLILMPTSDSDDVRRENIEYEAIEFLKKNMMVVLLAVRKLLRLNMYVVSNIYPNIFEIGGYTDEELFSLSGELLEEGLLSKIYLCR